MPGLTKEVEAKKKRKRDGADLLETKRSKRQVAIQESDQEVYIQSEILLLENQVLESRKHYNSIVTLLGYSNRYDAEDQSDIAAAVALCRIFCRLMAAGSMTKSREMADAEILILQWLKEQLVNYESSVLAMLSSKDIGRQSTALALLMRLMREEAGHLKLQESAIWRDGVFKGVLLSLVGTSLANEKRAEFVEKYLAKYDDIRYYAFALLG